MDEVIILEPNDECPLILRVSAEGSIIGHAIGGDFDDSYGLHGIGRAPATVRAVSRTEIPGLGPEPRYLQGHGWARYSRPANLILGGDIGVTAPAETATDKEEEGGLWDLASGTTCTLTFALGVPIFSCNFRASGASLARFLGSHENEEAEVEFHYSSNDLEGATTINNDWRIQTVDAAGQALPALSLRLGALDISVNQMVESAAVVTTISAEGSLLPEVLAPSGFSKSDVHASAGVEMETGRGCSGTGSVRLQNQPELYEFYGTDTAVKCEPYGCEPPGSP